ncbi:MAG: hypothetical protein E3J71_00405 [Candidatus Stahlbacteria bacterium]|nr:MAG: hypothetical protein E3J71_00405 [Candidatus Stahlbacteria bacterium]
MNKRYIFIGDIHGCSGELMSLLAKLEPTPQDEVVSVGDFVDRGPEAAKSLELWMDRDYKAVLGNHEDRLIDWLEGKDVFEGDGFEVTLEQVSKRKELVDYIRTLPLYLDFPEIGVCVVHGGVFPSEKIDYGSIVQNKFATLRLRYIRQEGESWMKVPLDGQKPGDVFWSEVWDGERMIIYGHTPTKNHKPKIEKKAIDLDTGCVYGGCLTAAILTKDKREVEFEFVNAEKAYYSMLKTGERVEL